MELDQDQVTLKKIVEFADLSDKAILEIGCGDGRVTALLVGHSSNVVAVDPDHHRISQAAKRVPGADCRVGSGENLEFPDQSFDLVMFTLSLHHQKCHQALAEASRVLRDDGRIVVIEPVDDGEIEQVCNVFHGETQALKMAMQSIDSSDLVMERSEIFETCWVFSDFDELMAWLCDYYAMTPDRERTRLIRDILGKKVHRRPLVLLDRNMILLLRKNSEPV